MESSGINTSTRQVARPAISRRSCDQCRARKIRCDRNSPCSGCVIAKLKCKHSTVAARSTNPRQRVAVPNQHEQKIDEIARNTEHLKAQLEQLDAELRLRPLTTTSCLNRPAQDETRSSLVQPLPSSDAGLSLEGDTPHINNLPDGIGGGRPHNSSSSSNVNDLASLRLFLRSLDGSNTGHGRHGQDNKAYKRGDNSNMPPLEASSFVLRWAKQNKNQFRLGWIFHVLPIDRFTEICQKVYFAVEEFCEVDYILANGYLFQLFSEYVITSGSSRFRDYCSQCEFNLQSALAHIPLLQHATMDVIAALTVGALYAMDNSKVMMAWTLTSAASSLCQTLGNHRRNIANDSDPLSSATTNLFWTIYKLDKGLALRLSRPSNIAESEILLSPDPDELRCVTVARIQGKVYDRLYSPMGLSQSDDYRIHSAGCLAEEVRGLILKCQDEDLNSPLEQDTPIGDMTRTLYLKGEQVIEYSLLALILRAIPNQADGQGSVSDACVAAARATLDLHEQCINVLWTFTDDPQFRSRYLNWTIMHTPFIAFFILISYAIQLLDIGTLLRLERFTASLGPGVASLESMRHPHRIYNLICETARQRIMSRVSMDSLNNATINDFQTDRPRLFNLAPVELVMDQDSLADWYQSSQQVMAMLDSDVDTGHL